jgi:glucokinase
LQVTLAAQKRNWRSTRLNRDPRAPLARTEVRSADYSSLQAVVAEFLEDVDLSVDGGSFAVAGPVIAGHLRTTNLPWVMDEHALALDLNLSSVHLMNDVEAVARSVPVLQREDLVTLNAGVQVATGSIGVIAPGTGLGESFLTWNGSQYVAHSSESGHADFAPTDERQIGPLQYLWRRVDHVAVERTTQCCSCTFPVQWISAPLIVEIHVAAGFTFAHYCAFRPRIPKGSARPTRRRDIAFPRSRFASMRAAASA